MFRAALNRGRASSKSGLRTFVRRYSAEEAAAAPEKSGSSMTGIAAVLGIGCVGLGSQAYNQSKIVNELKIVNAKLESKLSFMEKYVQNRDMELKEDIYKRVEKASDVQAEKLHLMVRELLMEDLQSAVYGAGEDLTPIDQEPVVKLNPIE